MSDDIENVETTQSTDPYIVWVNPAELLENPLNLRQEIGDVSELTATLKAKDGVGMIEPVVLVPVGDGFKIVAGHRRTKAARDAKWTRMPAFVRPDLVDATPQQIAAILVENVQRVDLTRSEVAKGYEQLAAFDDWDLKRIAEVTGKPEKEVEANLALAALPEKVRAAADTGALTLEDSLEIQALSDDPKFVERVARKANSIYGVRHVIVEEKAKRKNKARTAELTEELTSRGVQIVKRPKGWPWDCAEAEVRTLRDANGEPLDRDAVMTEPGFAAFIDTQYGTPQVVVICLRPEAHGFERTVHTTYKSDRQKREEAERERAAEALQEALEAATAIRHEFIRDKYGSAKGAKALFQEALRRAVDDPSMLDADAGMESLWTTLAGAKFEAIATAKQDRLSRMLVARWIAAEESNLARVMRGERYGVAVPRSIAWLERLTEDEDGYELGEAESQFLADLRERLAARAQTDSEDEEEEPEEEDTEADDEGVEPDDEDADSDV